MIGANGQNNVVTGRVEESRLDDAIRNADDLLVSSLRSEEGRRRKRRITLLITIGGLLMFAIALSIILAVGAGGHTAARDPGDKAAKLNEQGWKLWQERKLDDAADKFEEAVKLDPKFANAWNGLGWARFNNGDWDKAEEAFNKVLEIQPTHPAALNGLGQLYYARNELDKAETYLKKAAPNAPAAWWGLAKLYLLQGKWDDAQKYAEKVVAAGDKSAQPLVDAAKAKNLPDDLRKQIAPADKAPTPVAGAAAEGWKAWNKGRYEQAKALFEQALKANPKDTVALNGMGWTLLVTGDNEH